MNKTFPFSISTLDVFRFLFGFLIIFDLLQHFQFLQLYYTDQGLLPLEAARSFAEESFGPRALSVYFLSGSLPVTTVIYLLHIMLAVLFMFGWGLPYVTILLWFFQCSLCLRNMTIFDGGDQLAIILLFVAIFLPLKKGCKPGPVSALWGLFLVIQAFLIYFISALSKSHGAWSGNFNALSMALRLSNMRTEFGGWLLQFPFLLKGMTAGVYYLELIGSSLYLICFPFSNRFAVNVRKVISILFILLHFGILLTLKLWFFPMLYMTLWFVLYPRVKNEEDLIPAGKRKPFILLLQLVPVLVILAVININFGRIYKNIPVPRISMMISGIIPLPQYWGFFSPEPPSNNFQVHFLGQTLEGKKIYIIDQSLFTTHRHGTKFLSQLPEFTEFYMSGVGSFLCSKRKDLKTVTVEIENHEINSSTMTELEPTTGSWSEPCLNNLGPSGGSRVAR